MVGAEKADRAGSKANRTSARMGSGAASAQPGRNPAGGGAKCFLKLWMWRKSISSSSTLERCTAKKCCANVRFAKRTRNLGRDAGFTFRSTAKAKYSNAGFAERAEGSCGSSHFLKASPKKRCVRGIVAATQPIRLNVLPAGNGYYWAVTRKSRIGG